MLALNSDGPAPIRVGTFSLATVLATLEPDPPVSYATPRWTVVLVFHNAADGIAKTLRQFLRQTRPFKLVLVDKGSTDRSGAVCHSMLAGRGIDYVLLRAETPGQVAAIEAGLAPVDTEFVATCDTETYYPTSYLATAEAIFDADPHRTVAVSAYCLVPHKGQVRAAMAALGQLTAAWLLSRQSHVGGAGHSFRTGALRSAGGYRRERWPHPLADFEMMHQVMKQGRHRFALKHWCSSSTRCGGAAGWSFIERIAYHLTPFAHKDRYFRWLARRFRERHEV